ncbi:hypothetical protein EBB07_28575 [Paenibacillaceae bacterium]|nr:hypothetical protein EBB07_28575 [Paenibacillaceae bacterium]
MTNLLKQDIVFCKVVTHNELYTNSDITNIKVNRGYLNTATEDKGTVKGTVVIEYICFYNGMDVGFSSSKEIDFQFEFSSEDTEKVGELRIDSVYGNINIHGRTTRTNIGCTLIGLRSFD